jgi:hypothetical protein
LVEGKSKCAGLTQENGFGSPWFAPSAVSLVKGAAKGLHLQKRV